VRLRRPRQPLVVPIQCDLGTLRLDHRVTHEYGERPRPRAVTLLLQDRDAGTVGQFIADFPGRTLQIPRYLIDRQQGQERRQDFVEITVSW